MRHANPGYRMIMDQRRRADDLKFYYDASKEDSKARMIQNFENDSMRHWTGKEIQRRALKHRQEYNECLQERQNKLMKLFAEEEEQFIREINASIETPMQHRARMEKRLEQIRANRKQEHDEEVRRKLENRWIEECDPLRKQISLAFERQIAEDRKKQLVEKEEHRFDDLRIEDEYAEAVRKGVLEDQERRRREAQKLKDNQVLNKQTWTYQMQERDDNIRRKKEEDEAEGLMYKRMNEEDIRRAKIDYENKLKQQEQTRKDLDEINRQQMKAKKKALKKEKKLDKKYLKKAQKELRIQEEEELVNKLVAQRRMDNEKRLIKMQLDKKMAEDNRAEEYLRRVQQEHDFREDEERRIREEKRRNLMMDARSYQVYQMEERERMRQDAKRVKEDEKRQIAEDRALLLQRQREEAEEKRMKIQLQNQILERQTQIKRENEMRRKLEEQMEAQQTVQRWRDEERRIQEVLKDPSKYLPNGRWKGFK